MELHDGDGEGGDLVEAKKRSGGDGGDRGDAVGEAEREGVRHHTAVRATRCVDVVEVDAELSKNHHKYYMGKVSDSSSHNNRDSEPLLKEGSSPRVPKGPSCHE